MAKQKSMSWQYVSSANKFPQLHSEGLSHTTPPQVCYMWWTFNEHFPIDPRREKISN